MQYSISAIKKILYRLGIKFPKLFSLRILALALVLFVCVDYVQSGPVRIKNVEFHDQKRNQDLILSLPHKIRKYDKGDQYYFAFDLPQNLMNRLFPLRLIPDDCIIGLEVNGESIPLDKLKREDLCNLEMGISLNDFELQYKDGLQLGVTVEDTNGGDFGLSLARVSLLNISQRTILLILASYLFTLVSIKNWQQSKQLHYTWLVIVAFIFSFWPHNYNFNDWWQWINYMGNGLAIAFLALIGIFWRSTQKIYLWVDQIQQRILQISPRIFVTLCVLAFFLLTASLSQFLFDGLPHVADTHVQYVQSKIFAEGKLYEPSHPLRQFFDFQNAINDGKYYGGTFPGHPMLLAIGQLLGIPWLVNPFMGALTVWVVFLIANELAGRAAGYIAALLMLVSPMIVFMSSEYMNHVSCMFFLTLFLYAYIRMHKTGNVRYALVAGGAVGFAFLIRAQSAVLFALPITLHAAWMLVVGFRKSVLNYSIMLFYFCFFLSFLLYFQYETTGSPWIAGYNIFAGNYRTPLFLEFAHAERWGRILDDVRRSVFQMQITHGELMGWSTSSLWFIFLLYLFRLDPKYSHMIFLPVLGQYIGFMFMFRDEGSGVFLLNRYVYEASSCLVVLSGIAISRLPVFVTQYVSYANITSIRSIIAVAIVGLVITALPYQIIDLYRMYEKNYWEGNWSYYYTLSNSIQKPALVFMHRYQEYRLLYFTQPPKDSNAIIYALDRGHENQKLLDYYPQRHAYFVDGWNIKRIR